MSVHASARSLFPDHSIFSMKGSIVTSDTTLVVTLKLNGRVIVLEHVMSTKLSILIG